jgi:phage shock protein PspC (stress-responsive transcriptional regulator)
VFAGVASGLGAYFGVDPVIFRIGFVALTLAGGSGLLIYLLLWAVLPAVSYGGPAGPPPLGPAPGDPPIVAALRQGGAKSYLAIGAMILAVLLLVGPFARPTVVFALVLIGVGVVLMLQDRPAQAGGSAAPGPSGPPTPPAGGAQQPGEHWEQHGGPPYAAPPSQGGQGPSGGPSPAASATATQPGARDDTYPGWDSPSGGSPGGAWGPGGSPVAQSRSGYGASPSGWGAAPTSVAERRQRPRSILGWLTVAAALLATGLASALDNLGVVDLTSTRIVALVLTVIGVGLLVGSLWGRAWWLVLLGLLLVPVMAVTSVASDVPVRGRSGQQVERPLTLTEVQPEYQLSAGQFTLDLRQVDFGSRPHRIGVRMGAGDLNVILPNDQPVTVSSRIGAGEMNVLGHPSTGGFQVQDTVSGGGNARLGRLTLDLRLGVGQIVVSRGP